MRGEAREWIVALVPAVLLGLLMAAAGFMFSATLDAPERAAFGAMLAARGAIMLLAWLVLSALLGAAARTAYRRWVVAPSRLVEHAQTLLAADVGREIAAEGSTENRALAAAVNALAHQRNELRADIDRKVAAASRDIEQERSRLAALMSELTQSVVVCNLDGRVLLYNNRARLQFRALSAQPTLADGAELIGIGRSIYGVLDRALVAHALESVQQRLQRGAANPSAQFVTTTRGGQLLRVQMAPVRAVQELPLPLGELGGEKGLSSRVRRARAAAPACLPERALQGRAGGPQVEVGAAGPSPRPSPQGGEGGAPPELPLPLGEGGVRAVVPNANAGIALSGFVLMLDNITRDFADESARDQLLHGLTEGSRASLGNLQAAVEMLDYDDVDATTRERFHAVIRDEVHAMSERIQQLASHTVQAQKTRWPLEDMLGADFAAAAVRRIESRFACRASATEVDAALWLKVDSYSLLLAIAYLAGRLAEEYGVKALRLRLATAGARAQLDLVWAGQAMSTETVTNWETDTIKVGLETSALTVRDVVERHGGAFWFERERVRHEAFFRFLLPLASEHEQLAAAQFLHGESRPEYYDFDLFKASPQSDELGERRLTELSYTVFDTETTGLSPSQGDEIIQVGATRIVAGKLRREESFEQLVDPQRSIPAAGIPIHGITPDMIVGQPTIATVLPAFHAFAQDTVLVAHNAAFDMRFLQLKEEATGVVFDQPVLDTLLLSAVVHPNQESHRLEEIAARFDVTVIGRHTALGDAMVTAEVFLKMIPLLAERGIHTLAQAREAAQQTYFARLKY
ncbi:MAG: exonuclease domain-containing protein [Burkholderiales bacterium]